ncbi:MAG TPA: dihydropteroate synthase [Thermoanaerobaculia bacterium]|nr:dihydropteroate synthase [Thermoanaerobaculia bacterium]
METARLPRPHPAAGTLSSTWTLRLPRGRTLSLGARPRIVGILNLTPDSFSDGGLWSEPERAVARGLAMLDEGAELLDLGAESTRPGGGVYGAGARPVAAEEELARLLPVLERLRAATDAPISVDTRKGVVARRALAAGADLINDVSALSDPELAAAAAAAGCPVVLMHSRGELATMQRRISFRDLVGEVRAELAEAAGRAAAAGIDPGQLILDPGIGFGKTAEQNLLLIQRLADLAALGRPLLLGASRKSFLAQAAASSGRAGLTRTESVRAPGEGASPSPPEGWEGDRGVAGGDPIDASSRPPPPHRSAVSSLEIGPPVGATSVAQAVTETGSVGAAGQPSARLPGSLAALGWAAAARVALVRVHDVAESAQFLSVWEAIAEAQG